MNSATHLLVDCKLIQDYQMTSELKADAQVVATHFEGAPAYLSKDTEGAAYFTHRDPTSSSGWARQYLGYAPSHIAAAHHEAKGTVLLCVMQPDSANGSPIVRVMSRKRASEAWLTESFEFIPGTTIAKVRLKNVRGTLYCMFIYQLAAEDETFPYRMAFAEFKDRQTSFKDHSGHAIDSLNADIGVGPNGDVGAYVLFSPQIYWRPLATADSYKRQFDDKHHHGADHHNLTVWQPQPPNGALAPGFLAQAGHLGSPNFTHPQDTPMMAYPLDDPSGTMEPLLKLVTKWIKVYDTHGTTTDTPFSLLRPRVEGVYRALGCVGVNSADPILDNISYGTYAIHKSFAVGGKYTEDKAKGGVAESESQNSLGIWYTDNCGGSKKCASISKIVPGGSSGFGIGTFYAREGCGRMDLVDDTICCPSKHPKRKSLLLFMPLRGNYVWQVASVPTVNLATSLAVVESSSGASNILCTQDGGLAYRLRGMSRDQKGEWESLPSINGVGLSRVVAAANGNDDLNVFAISSKGHPYHALLTRVVMRTSGVAKEEANAFLPLLTKEDNISSLDVVVDPYRNVSVFALGHVGSKLSTQFWMADARTSNWTMQAVQTDTDAKMQEIRSFSVQISALDKNDLPMMEENLRIWSEGPALVKINGKSQFLDKNTAVELGALLDGRCRIMIPTNTIHAPILHVHASFMNAEEYVSISPNADIQIKLAQLDKPGALAGAQKNSLHSKPEPLFPKGTNGPTEGELNEVGAYLSQSMRLLPEFDYASDLKYLRWNREVQGKPAAKTAKPRALQRLAPMRELHFGLRMERGKAKYFNYTPTLAAQKIESFSDAAKIFSGTWGDAWNFIKNAGTRIAAEFDVIISTVGKAVHAAMTFVINGVKYVFNGIVSLVQEVFTMVEGVFSTIGVAFNDLVQWLGYLFDWDNILRSKKAIQLTMNFGLDLQKITIHGLRNKADAFIDGLKSKMDAAFDTAIAALDPGLTMEAANAQDAASPESKSINAHNTVFNSLMDNKAGGGIQGLPTSSGQVLGELGEKLERDFGELLKSPKLRSMVDRLLHMPMDGEAFLRTSMATLLELIKDLADFAINIAKDLLDAILDLLVVQIGNLQAALNASWNIPLVADLYKFITKENSMSTMDLFSLMLAVPVTPLYKISRGVAPFPDQDSLTLLENHYQELLLQVRREVDGNAPAHAKQRALKPLNASQKVDWNWQNSLQAFCLLVQGTCKLVAIPVDGILAAKPPLPSGLPKPGEQSLLLEVKESSPKIDKYYEVFDEPKTLRELSYISAVVELIDHLASVPFSIFESVDRDKEFEAIVQSGRRYIWSALFIPPIVDLVNVIRNGELLENYNTPGIVCKTVFSVIQSFIYTVDFAWLTDWSKSPKVPYTLSISDYLSKICKTVPGAFALLRHDELFMASDGATTIAYSIIKTVGKSASLGASIWKYTIILKLP